MIFKTVTKKILAVLIIFMLILTNFSTTIYAVSDTLDNSTSSEEIEEAEEEQIDDSQEEEESIDEDEETNITSNTTSSDTTSNSEVENKTVLDDVEINVDYSYSDDSLSCTVTLTSNYVITLIELKQKTESEDEENTYIEDDSFTISDDGLTASATFTENIEQDLKITLENEETIELNIVISEIIEETEEEVTVEDVYVDEETGVAVISLDDGIAVVSSGDYILEIDDGDTAYIAEIEGSHDLLGHDLQYVKYNGTSYLVFCVQYAVDSADDTRTVGDDVTTHYMNDDYEHIAKMIYFGYTDEYGTSIPSTTAQWKAACATQQYVWEYVYNNINSSYGYPDRDSWVTSYMSSSIYSSWLSSTKEAYSDYYDTEVSFDGKEYDVDLGGSKTLTDSNGVLKYYPTFSKTKNNVTFSHTKGSNTLTISVSSSCTASEVTFDSSDYSIYKGTANRDYDEDTMSSYMHFKMSDAQNVLFSNYLEAQSFEVTINIETVTIKVYKTDSEGNYINGAKIGMYSDSDCTDLIESHTATANGLTTFSDLEPSTTYYFKEISAPTGYLINSTVKSKSVSSGTGTVTIVDEEPTGEITVTKKNTNGDTVSGATFKVTAAEDITNVAGTKTYYSSGDTVTTLTTGSDGTATISDLPLGKYTITETSVPEGYLLNTTSKTITLSYEDDETEVIYGSATIVNEEPTGTITVTKENMNGDGVKGAVFKITAAETITNVAGTVTYYTSGDTVGTITTGSGGTATISDLPLGKYTITETSVPEGYLLNTTSKTVTLSYKDDETEVIYGSATIVNEEPTGTITVTKENMNGDGVKGAVFKITAAETITNVAGTVTYYTSGDTVGTITTGSSGTATISDLPLGKYTITEISVPTGYLLNSTPKTITLSYKDMYTSVIYGSVTIVDSEPTGTITIEKTDTDTGNEERVISGSVFHADASLAGTVFTLYAAEDITNVAKTVTYFTEDEAIATFTFDEEGEATIEIITSNSTITSSNNSNTLINLSVSGTTLQGLPLGTYYAIETTVSEGYMQNTTTYTFDLEYEDMYTDVISLEEVVENTVQKGQFSVIKISSDDNTTADVIEGSELTAILTAYVDYYGSFDEALLHLDEMAEDEYAVLTMDSDGYAISNYLAYGDYTVNETYTPSNREETIEEFYITIDSDGCLYKYVENDLPLESYLKIVKYDENSGEQVTYSNATFKLYYLNEETDEWEEVGCKTSKTTYYEWTTDEEGIAYTESKLDAGIYKVVEIVTPDGFLEPEDEIIFEITTDNETLEWDDDYDAHITVSVTNEQPKGELIINKTVNLKEDVDLSLVDVDYTGIEFTLYAAETIIDYTDGEVIYNAGDVVGVYNLEEDGTLDITDLWMGSYTLEETTTLDGLVVNDTVYDVTFTKEDNTTKVYTVELDIENDATLVEISKTDVDENLIDGSTLTIYDSDGNEVLSFETSSEDSYSIEGLHVYTTYTVSETTTPEGYITATDEEIYIENTTEIQSLQMKDKRYSISKLNVAGEEIEGAELTVYDTDGNVVDEWVSTSDVHYISGLVEGGTYTLHEEYSPDGYVYSADYEFTVSEEKVDEHYDLIDEIVYVTKTNVDGDLTLAGTGLTVYDSEGNIVDSWYVGEQIIELTQEEQESLETNGYLEGTITSDEETSEKYVIETVNGKNYYRLKLIYSDDTTGYYYINLDGTENYHMIRDLIEGETYTLVETYTLDEYVTSLPIEFTVPTDKSDLEIIMIDKQYSISKLNVAGEEIEGAELIVYDTDGNIVDNWVSTNELHYISGLTESSTYTLHEEYVSDGYVYSTDYEFIVSEEKVDEHYDLIDETVYVTKTDVDGDLTLAGTGLTVYDSEGNIVDSWTVGEQIIELTQEEQLELEENDYLELSYDDTAADTSDKNDLTTTDETTDTEEETTTDDTDEDTSDEETNEEESTEEDIAVISAVIEKVSDKEYYRLKLVYSDDTISYYYINLDGTENYHMVRNLIEGETYTLVETYTLNEYITSLPIEFTVPTDKSDLEIIMIDKQYSISKLNVAGEETEGAELTVYDTDGNIIDNWVSTSDVHYISGLVEGRTYTLVETATTNGYVTTTDIEFTVSEEKTDEHLNVVDKEVISTKTDVDGNILTGTGLAVKDLDGNLIDSWTVGEQIIELTKEEQSELEENGTLSGTTQIEVATTVTLTSDDNKLSSSVLDILLETIEVLADETKEQTEETIEDENTENTDETESTEDAADETTEDTTDTTDTTETETTEESSTTTYEINYTITKVTDTDYYRLKIEFNGNISYYYINLDGTESYHLIRNLVEGNTYTLSETYTLDTYVTAKDVEFTVTEDKDIQNITMIDKRYSISKLNVAGEEVEDATLQVIDNEGNIIDEWVSTSEVHYISGLVEGETYTLHEETTPSEYVTITDLEFTVSYEKEDEHLDIIDKQYSISNIDVEGNEIEGAELTIYDEEGNIVDQWISTTEAHYITGLEEGKTYTLVETLTPEGYVTVSDLEFSVSTEKENEHLDVVNKQYLVSKVDTEGNSVEGAYLQIIDSDGSIVDEWISTADTYYVTGLTEGNTYILIETTSPDNFVKANSIEFTVSYEKENETLFLVDIKVGISKVTANGESLEGATMQILDEDGNIIDEFVSNENIYYASNLEEGRTYTLIEIEAPDGYDIAESQEFTVNTSKEDQYIEVIDYEAEVQDLSGTPTEEVLEEENVEDLSILPVTGK